MNSWMNSGKSATATAVSSITAHGLASPGMLATIPRPALRICQTFLVSSPNNTGKAYPSSASLYCCSISLVIAKTSAWVSPRISVTRIAEGSPITNDAFAFCSRLRAAPSRIKWSINSTAYGECSTEIKVARRAASTLSK